MSYRGSKLSQYLPLILLKLQIFVLSASPIYKLSEFGEYRPEDIFTHGNKVNVESLN